MIRKGADMQSLITGTLAGAGSFRCDACGYVMSQDTADELPPCPSCGGEMFSRASLFADGFSPRGAAPDPPSDTERAAMLERADAEMEEPGQYLVWSEGDNVRVAALAREWTRIGRSLAADVRFDDPTVSRRHALIVRQADGVRVLDDRSLNGVFVNGERVEWRALHNGDEIVVGRYRLHYVESADRPAETAAHGGDPRLEADL